MKQFSVNRRVCWNGAISERSAEVMRIFGLDRQDLQHRVLQYSCRLRIGPGQIGLITGPSGSGKTLLLRELYNSVEKSQRLWISRIPLKNAKSVIDCMKGPIEEVLHCLCRAGLGDVFTMLTSPSRLSEGQKYRYRIARAWLSGRRYLFADEFGSALDRPGAGVLASQIRQTISKSGQIFIAASCREDLADQLKPDVIIQADRTGRIQQDILSIRKMRTG
jgi:ABC-type ATPase with predicted acetyltransferase domain